ncbi:hypothetical protein P5673_016384 [Acropora cervicornis]|uniref:Uncharacterized protein n=1 Tax=Acropora cervicornis TaxID=6130 RepID=A0AAD9QG28_ACRCE|nr:hypothetical protein P5673_016384 [Acropora cervicornis]
MRVVDRFDDTEKAGNCCLCQPVSVRLVRLCASSSRELMPFQATATASSVSKPLQPLLSELALWLFSSPGTRSLAAVDSTLAIWLHSLINRVRSFLCTSVEALIVFLYRRRLSQAEKGMSDELIVCRWINEDESLESLKNMGLSDKEAVLFNPYVTVSNNKHGYSPRVHMYLFVLLPGHSSLVSKDDKRRTPMILKRICNFVGYRLSYDSVDPKQLNCPYS